MKKFVVMVLISTGILGFMASSASAGYRLDIRENKLEIKLNRVQFAQEYVGTVNATIDSLSSEQMHELKALNNEFQKTTSELAKEYSSDLTYSEKEFLFGEMKEALALYIGKILIVIDDNESAVQYVEDWYTLFQTNEELREENRSTLNAWIKEITQLQEELVQ